VNRDALRPVVLAVVCGLAVILASATLTTTVETTAGGGAGSGGGSSLGASEGDQVDLGGEMNRSPGLVDLGSRGNYIFRFCVAWLTEPLVIGAVVLGLVGIGAAVRQKAGVLGGIGVTTAFAVPVALVYLVVTAGCDVEGEQGLPDVLTGQSTGGGGASGGAPNVPAVPVDVPVFVYVVVAAGLVTVIAIAVSDREKLGEALAPVVGRETSTTTDADEAQSEIDTGAVARAAGRAADRIEMGTDVDNEVYRAWAEMTRYLDLDHPKASTPAEFARAAEDADMDPRAVEELTEQFERVRYGGEAATAERERRAVAALRRIEDRYADRGQGGNS